MQIGMLGSLEGSVPPSRSRPPPALGSPLDPARHGPRRILGRGRTPPSWWSPPSRRSWAQPCWQPGRVHNPDLGQQTLPGSESQGEGTGGVLAAWPPRCPRQAVPAKRRVTLSPLLTFPGAPVPGHPQRSHYPASLILCDSKSGGFLSPETDVGLYKTRQDDTNRVET